MSFARRAGSGTTNSVFRKVTSSTAFGAGGSNMLSLSSSANSGTTTAASGGNIGTNPSGGGSAGGGSAGGGGNTDGCAEIEALMSSAVVTDISEISKNYSSGAFEAIKATLNQTLYNNYSLGLYTARRPLNATYEKVRKFINTNLEGLLQSINLYNTNTSVTAHRDAYKIIADKFNDPN